MNENKLTGFGNLKKILINNLPKINISLGINKDNKIPTGPDKFEIKDTIMKEGNSDYTSYKENIQSNQLLLSSDMDKTLTDEEMDCSFLEDEILDEGMMKICDKKYQNISLSCISANYDDITENNGQKIDIKILSDKLQCDDYSSDICITANKNNKKIKNSNNSVTTGAALSDTKNGRWNQLEHQNFLQAMLNYGKDWVKIQLFLVTRSASQARSHAQKFFGGLRKEFEDKYNYDKNDTLFDKSEKISAWIRDNIPIQKNDVK